MDVGTAVARGYCSSDTTNGKFPYIYIYICIRTYINIYKTGPAAGLGPAPGGGVRYVVLQQPVDSSAPVGAASRPPQGCFG